MVEMYCMKCKKKVEVVELKFNKKIERNGMLLYSGRCPECGGKTSKISKTELN